VSAKSVKFILSIYYGLCKFSGLEQKRCLLTIKREWDMLGMLNHLFENVFFLKIMVFADY